MKKKPNLFLKCYWKWSYFPNSCEKIRKLNQGLHFCYHSSTYFNHLEFRSWLQGSGKFVSVLYIMKRFFFNVIACMLFIKKQNIAGCLKQQQIFKNPNSKSIWSRCVKQTNLIHKCWPCVHKHVFVLIVCVNFHYL